jgi:hypothetical protein
MASREIVTLVEMLATTVMLASGPVILAGLFLVMRVHKSIDLIGRLRRTARVRIADAAPGTVVAIVGRVCPSEEGSFFASLCGKQAVLAHARSIERRHDRRVPRTLADRAGSRAFLIDDGSGQLARVDRLPEGALMWSYNPARPGSDLDETDGREPYLAFLSKHTAVCSSDVQHDPAARAHGADPKALFAVRSTTVTWFEEALSPGDEVCVRGLVHAARPGTARGLGSGSPGVRILLAPPGGAEGALIVSNADERAMSTHTQARFSAGKRLMIGGAIVGAAGYAVGQLADMMPHLLSWLQRGG